MAGQVNDHLIRELRHELRTGREQLARAGCGIDVPRLSAVGKRGAGRSADDLFGEERLRCEVEPREGDVQRREVQVLTAILEFAGIQDTEFDRLFQFDAVSHLRRIRGL